jgi:uncharacterized coiled-coil DUF342 family protein
MATMAREAWTDERLDDLKTSMHREFGQVQRQFDQVQRQFDQVHQDIRDLRGEVNGLRETMNARFDSLQRTLALGYGSIIATVIGAIFAKGLF